MSERDVAAKLGEVHVVDLADGVAGQFCGRLFAHAGASVTFFESMAGTSTRRMPPFVDPDAATDSYLFRHLNAAKHVCTVQAFDPAADPLSTALEAADVVILEGSLAPNLVEERAPSAIVCDVTPFGRDTSLGDWKGNEMIYQALAGTMIENGRADREPLYGCGHRASYAAGVIGYSGCLAALALRGHGRPSGSAARVDVAIAEVAASMSYNRITQYSYNGYVERREGASTPRGTFRCSDGWLSVFVRPDRWEAMCQAIGAEALLDDPRFVTGPDRLENWKELVECIEEVTVKQRVDDLLERCQARRVLAGKARTPTDLVRSQHLHARSFWRTGSGDESNRTVLAAPYRLQRLEARDLLPQAEPGEQQPAGAAARPLAGVRVLDMTAAWAGPMATRLLAYLGAEVIKVEGPKRMDGWRAGVEGGHPSWYPDFELGERPYNRCCLFNTQNHDKLAIALDVRHPLGRKAFLRLVEQSDVLISNSTPETFDRLGLGRETVAKRNPRIVIAEMPAYGLTGPEAHYVALGPNMEFMCGMASLVGYGDGRPVDTGPAYMDPIGGFNGAAGVLTALIERNSTGYGQHVEVTQVEAAMHWIGEELLRSYETMEDWHPRGNLLDHLAPHNAFRTRGEDEWVAIAATTDEEWRALAAAVDPEALLADERYATVRDRIHHERELQEIIERWTRDQDKHEAARLLQAKGVPAAPVCNARDLAQSDYLQERGIITTLQHPEAGEHLYQGLPFHISGCELGIRTPAPTFSQHTWEVLERVAGYDTDEIRELDELGVIAGFPVLV